MRSLLITALSLFVCLAPASAQEWVVGVGATDFRAPGEDSLALDLEYRHRPFVERRVVSLAWGAQLGLTGEGDGFVGGGLWARWQWPGGWFVDASVMPGLYGAGAAGNSLGAAVQIRSLLGVGKAFAGNTALSVAISHKSNAGLADANPGMNVYSLRYHIRF
ncbi:MAG: acyloxyacyl hydrolase [Pseudomonadota bacterium]